MNVLEWEHWKWLPGAKAVLPDGRWFRVEESTKKLRGDWKEATPDLTDAATVGTLLLLFLAHAAPSSVHRLTNKGYMAEVGEGDLWCYCTGNDLANMLVDVLSDHRYECSPAHDDWWEKEDT